MNQFGLCRFQNSFGIPLSGLIELLQLYLRSTMIEQGGKVFIQKSGVYIGSCLAPVLSEIYLCFVYRAIYEELQSTVPGCRVLRYLDDYLVVHPTEIPVNSISPCFLSAGSHGGRTAVLRHQAEYNSVRHLLGISAAFGETGSSIF
ncbi:unnamed protein product [Ixodes hexagonus]